MRVVYVTPPGRFPTVIHDPGRWWESVQGSVEIRSVSANALWWSHLCTKEAVERVRERPERRWRRVWSRWTGRGREPVEAAKALEALTDPATYRGFEVYRAALAPLAQHLDLLNSVQDDLYFDVESGVRVLGLNYGSSEAVTRYAQQEDTALYRMIRNAVIPALPEPDLLLLRATSPQDLVTGLIVAHIVRTEYPGAVIVLADHWYENFSLSMHIGGGARLEPLMDVVDAVVEQRDGRDQTLLEVIHRMADGVPPSGWLDAEHPPCGTPAYVRVASQLTERPTWMETETFSPVPIVSTRLSAAACYWRKCTFCVQNVKYGPEPAAPKEEVLDSIARVIGWSHHGIRDLIFADEAVSVPTARLLSTEFAGQGLRWSVRMKLEPSMTPDLFDAMYQAGCYEILTGIESTSERTLKRMGKWTPGLDEVRMRHIIEAMGSAGILPHLNLIGGFPGESLKETVRSVDFVCETLADLPGATFLLNDFAVFPHTEIARRPAAYGIELEVPSGDMPPALRYRHVSSLDTATRSDIEALRRRMNVALGWADLDYAAGGELARYLFFTSGHGAWMKAEIVRQREEERVERDKESACLASS